MGVSPLLNLLLATLLWTSLVLSIALVFSCSTSDLDEPWDYSGGGNNNSTSASTADDTLGQNIATDNSEDYVGKVSFARTVTIVFSDSEGAKVSEAEGVSAKVSGNDVTITNTASQFVMYNVSGSTTNGFLKIYSDSKQGVTLSSASIRNPGGAAINSQSHKRLFLVLNGDNHLEDGSVSSSGDYTDETSDEDMKAALFAEGKIIVSGTGSLTVTANGKSAITSDDYVRIMDGPTVKVNSAKGHGIRGKDAIIISGGDIDVNVSATGKKGFNSDTLVFIGGGNVRIESSSSVGTVDGELTGASGIKADCRFEMTGGNVDITCTGIGAKGISGDNVGYIRGGTLTVKSTGRNWGNTSSSGGGPGGGPGGFGPGGSGTSYSKGAKAINFDGNLYISGGTIDATSANHEAIEAEGLITISGGRVRAYASDDAINAGSHLTIKDGVVFAQSTSNDGLDANGNVVIDGGLILAVGSTSPEMAIDANTEQRYTVSFNGGTTIMVGGITSGVSAMLPYVSATPSAGKNYALYDGNTLITAFTVPSNISSKASLVIDSSKLKSGNKYTLLSDCTLSGGTNYFDALYTGVTATGGTSSTLTASK